MYIYIIMYVCILYVYVYYIYIIIYININYQRVKIPRSPKHSRVVTARRILDSAGSTTGARSWRLAENMMEPMGTWEVMWYPGTPLDLYGYHFVNGPESYVNVGL
jgi:hypothetical protein